MRLRIAETAALFAWLTCLLFTAPNAQAGYQYVRDFAPQGVDSSIVGVTVDVIGSHVYLATDSATSVENRTIQKFTGSGTFVTRIGAADAPNDVATSRGGGGVFLADGLSGVINLYSNSGDYIATFNDSPDHVELGSRISIVEDQFSSLWTADGLGYLTEFVPFGGVRSRFAIPGIVNIPGIGPSATPSAIAVSTGSVGHIYIALANNVVDGGGDRILVLGRDGFLINEFGTSGSGNGQLRLGPLSGLAVDRFNRVYVGDSGNNRVQVFYAPLGQYLTQFGTPGSGNGQLHNPGGVAIDSRGDNVWVADLGNGRVQQFQVPEPSSALLLGAGAVGLVCIRRFRRPAK